MKRLLPFRTYAESDVINMYAINNANDSITDSGDGDAGVVVAVLSGNATDNPAEYKDESFLGFAGGSHMGFVGYPDTQLKIKAAASTDSAIGITLCETVNKDENGQKLIYNKDKWKDLGVVVSGQATPVVTRGIFEFSYRAFGVGTDKSYVPPVGSRLVQSATAGLMTGMTEAAWRTVVTGSGTAFLPSLGKVIATGAHVSLDSSSDYYSGGTGVYYTAICKIDIT